LTIKYHTDSVYIKEKKMISYEYVKNDLTVVYLDGKRVGKIVQTLLGWQYFPKGSTLVGEPFKTLKECKQSLEDD